MSIKSNRIKKSEDAEERQNQLRIFNKKAKKFLVQGNIESAFKNFSLAENVYGCAYCKFLTGKADEALILLNLIKNSSPAVNWLICLISFVKREEINNKPTYFQIRNFFEPDLEMLIRYKNFDFAKKICENIDFLATYNKEIYKFTARVFLSHGAIEDSIYFLKKSIDIIYKDPEVHFMLGEAYLKLGEKEKAKKEFVKSNEVTSGYFPAINKLKEFN